jgi:hypothetical protein
MSIHYALRLFHPTHLSADHKLGSLRFRKWSPPRVWMTLYIGKQVPYKQFADKITPVSLTIPNPTCLCLESNQLSLYRTHTLLLLTVEAGAAITFTDLVLGSHHVQIIARANHFPWFPSVPPWQVQGKGKAIPVTGREGP